jgi:hypothetical protein
VSYTGLTPRSDHHLRVGSKALATINAFLSELETALEHTAWHDITIIDLARSTSRSPAAFYQYFGDIDVAFNTLMQMRADQGLEPTTHMTLIIWLLEWKACRGE